MTTTGIWGSSTRSTVIILYCSCRLLIGDRYGHMGVMDRGWGPFILLYRLPAKDCSGTSNPNQRDFYIRISKGIDKGMGEIMTTHSRDGCGELKLAQNTQTLTHSLTHSLMHAIHFFSPRHNRRRKLMRMRQDCYSLRPLPRLPPTSTNCSQA